MQHTSTNPVLTHFRSYQLWKIIKKHFRIIFFFRKKTRGRKLIYCFLCNMKLMQNHRKALFNLCPKNWNFCCFSSQFGLEPVSIQIISHRNLIIGCDPRGRKKRKKNKPVPWGNKIIICFLLEMFGAQCRWGSIIKFLDLPPIMLCSSIAELLLGSSSLFLPSSSSYHQAFRPSEKIKPEGIKTDFCLFIILTTRPMLKLLIKLEIKHFSSWINECQLYKQ